MCISRGQISAFLDAQTHLKPSSLKTCWAYVRAFNRWLRDEHRAVVQDEGIAVRDPVKRLPKAVPVTIIRETLNNPNTSTVRGKRDKAALELLWCSALRASELTSLKLDDVDREAKSLRVMGKGRKERLLPISASAIEALDEWLRVRYKYACSESGRFVFLTCYGRPMTYKSLRGLVQKAGGINPHVVRHTSATELSRHVDVVTLRDFLGHADLSTTQLYVSVSRERLKAEITKAMEKIDTYDVQPGFSS